MQTFTMVCYFIYFFADNITMDNVLLFRHTTYVATIVIQKQFVVKENNLTNSFLYGILDKMCSRMVNKLQYLC